MSARALERNWEEKKREKEKIKMEEKSHALINAIDEAERNLASGKGHEEVVDLFLSAKVDVDLRDQVFFFFFFFFFFERKTPFLFCFVRWFCSDFDVFVLVFVLVFNRME